MTMVYGTPPSYLIHKNPHMILLNRHIPKKLQPRHNNTPLMSFFGPNIKKYLSMYHSGCMFSPRPSTLLHTIRRNHLLSFPGLTSNLISKNLPPIEASIKGHLEKEQRHLHSTQQQYPSLPDNDLRPPQEPDNIQTNKILCLLFENLHFIKTPRHTLIKLGTPPHVPPVTRCIYLLCITMITTAW